MKYMTGKAKMMVTGIALGTVAAGGMAALIAAGKVGVAGSLVVVFLMALAGVSGWMIGIQMMVYSMEADCWDEKAKIKATFSLICRIQKHSTGFRYGRKIQ